MKNRLLSPNYGLLANLVAGFYNAFMSLVEWKFLEGRWLPWPVKWSERFGRDAPLLVEIGFGNGQFLLDLAGRRPDANLVGLEISQPSLRKTQRKIRSQNLDNVLVVHGRADQALWTLFAPQTISAVYVNFPDPWPKAGHEGRRLIDTQFLALLASRMSEGATLDLATDVGAYAHEIAQHLTSCSQFESRTRRTYVHDDESRVRTKYESIARAEGRICYYFQWRRNAAPATNPFPVPNELEMPHVVLNTTVDPTMALEEIAGAFKEATLTGEWGTIRFIELFNARDADALLVDTFIDDKAVTQRLGLSIRARGSDNLVLSVHEIGFPRATIGVHRAIKRLALELMQRHPYLSQVSSNLTV